MVSYVDLTSLPPNTRCSDKLLVLRETHPGQYIRPPHPGQWQDAVIFDSIGITAYSKLQDKYDFLILHPQTNGGNHGTILSNEVEGIGFPRTSSYLWDSLSNRIQSALQISSYSVFKNYMQSISKPEYQEWKGYRQFWIGVNFHEIGHHWCCYGKGFYQDPRERLSAHYHNGMVFGDQGPDWSDPLQISYWDMSTVPPQCGNQNEPGRKVRFSSFTQYLMGLVPPDEVPPTRIHTWDTVWADPTMPPPFSPIDGPGCAQSPDYHSPWDLTLPDFVRLNGPRVPSAAVSQKEFNVLPLVIVKFGETLDTAFIEFLQKRLLDTLPEAWSYATQGRSKLHLGCDLYEGAGIRATRRASAGPEWKVRNGNLEVLPASNAAVRVKIYALDGKELVTLFEGKPPAALPMRLPLRNSGLRSGTYMIRVSTSSREKSGTMVLVDW